MSAEEKLDLADIPGLGPVRRQALAEAGVKDLQGLLALKQGELAAIKGMGHWQARKIREFLRQRGLSVAEAEEVEELRAPQTAPEAPREVSTPASAATGAEPASGAGRRKGKKQVRGADEEPAPAAEVPVTVEPASPETDLQAELKAQRERLPESALVLMEAIRQAAVAKQLTRQLTRLLITAGEFASEDRALSDEQRNRALEVLAQVDTALHRAVEKRALRAADQRDLADRIRKRRKELEALLERMNAGE